MAARQLRIKTKPLKHFWLAPAQRDVLLMVPGLSKTIKNKLAKDNSSFAVAEVASITMSLAGDLLESETSKQVALLLVAQHLLDRLQEGIEELTTEKVGKKSKVKKKPAKHVLYQIKITLLDSRPKIWRRIQIQDCTLDKLHEHNAVYQPVVVGELLLIQLLLEGYFAVFSCLPFRPICRLSFSDRFVTVWFIRA